MSLPRAGGSMLYSLKNSFTSKINTLLKLERGSNYYLSGLGANIGFFVESPQNYTANILTNFLVNELTRNGVFVSNISTNVEEDFYLNISVEGRLEGFNQDILNNIVGTFNTSIKQRAQ